ncbi:hypothetical protein [Gluconobacter vitians]|nr:hypothetical protein [Gluconobacter vitians]
MIDFSSWHSLLATLIGLALFTLIGVGIRLLTMLTIQQRRERMNRQINERLRVLMAAYRTLGGSFTGTLLVDPTHKRDLGPDQLSGSDRNRRIRDAVEAALSDIILLGTEEQVRMAGRAAAELVAGRPVPTHDLVVSLRNFIRKALNLESLPSDLVLPEQGPARPSSNGGNKGDGKEGGKGGGGGGGGGDGGGGGGGMGMQGGTDPALHHSETDSHSL